jgi:hypothetical protein
MIMIAFNSMMPATPAVMPLPGSLWRWYADESPLNDLDEAEDSIDAMDDELADALAELLDEPAPLADPGTP